MAKIPVIETIAQAREFTRSNFLEIAGIVWLPWAIAVAITLLMTPQIWAMQLAATSRDTATIGHAFLILFPIMLTNLGLMAIQFVGIAELALDQREGPQYAYLSVGKPVLRYIASWFLAGAIIVGAIVASAVVILIAVFIANLAMPTMGANLPNAMRIIIVAGIYLPMIYLATRLLFFALPVVVAEGRIGVRRSWELSRGNFWRIAALSLCLWVPLILMQLIFLVIGDFPPTAPLNATPAQIAAIQAAAAAWARPPLRK